MTRTVSLRVTVATALAVATVVSLAGCTAGAHVARPTGTPSASATTTFSIPPATSADLARLVYRTASDSQETTVAVPANATGFSVGAACEGADSRTHIGWEISPGSGGPAISSGRVRCDGNNYVDSALVPGSAQSVHLVLTGDLRRIRAAYVVLQPSS